MSTILIVDDEQSYREELELTLSASGHIVMTASDGQQAIELGCRYRPDVLVADWMLTDQVNGFCVADALRLVHPEIRVILITGFASGELQAEAENRHVFELIEKPFEVKRIRTAVNRALREAACSYGTDLPVAVLEIDPSGAILYANAYAEELIGNTYLREDTGNIYDLFWEKTDEILGRAAREWVKIIPFSEKGLCWYIRASTRTDSIGRIYCILDRGDRFYQTFPAVQMLLGISVSHCVSWPNDEHVLIVDGDPNNRRRVAGALREAGCCVSHIASNAEEGARLLERDPKVKLVVLGATRTSSSGLTVRKLKGIRPDVSIVECG